MQNNLEPNHDVVSVTEDQETIDLTQKRKREREESELAEQTPVNPDLNILTHFEEVLENIAKIEGQRWKELQLDQANDSKQTLTQALRSIKNLEKDSRSTFTVYGSGGINRWYIRADGSVEFSAQHAYKEKDVIKAKLLGFKIYR